MKLNIFFSIIVLLFSVTYLSAQADSLAVTSDSLLVTTDSLQSSQAFQDSLRNVAILDSLSNLEPEINYDDYLDLQNKVEQYKTDSRASFIDDRNKNMFWSLQGHIFGLPSDNYLIKRGNFTELASIYPTSLKLQNYNRFYSEALSGDYYTLSKELYQLPVTAIEVVASTGDYDLATGYFALKKNKFLDKYNIDFRMNFVKGDLYYGNELASNSSSTLIIPLTNSQLNISLNSISYEGPYYRLSPAFQLNQTIFEETSQAISLLYNTSYLDLGLKYSTDSYKKITPNTLNRQYFQLLLAKELAVKHWSGKISYEYFIHNEDFYSQELNSLSSDIDQIVDFEVASDYDKFNLSNRLVLTYPYQLLSNSAVTYNFFSHWQLGLFTNNRRNLKKDNLLTEYNYDSDTAIAKAPFYLNEKNYTGLDFGFASSDLNLAAKVGYASIKSQLFEYESNNNYIALKSQVSGNYSHTFGKYRLNLASQMKYYIELLGLDIHYTPVASSTSSLELSRDMNHDNFIKAGVSYLYIDSFLALENASSLAYQETSLLDVYLGFQITKQFEIKGYWKNILNNESIAGYQTIPQSITVLISWNFLN